MDTTRARAAPTRAYLIDRASRLRVLPAPLPPVGVAFRDYDPDPRLYVRAVEAGRVALTTEPGLARVYPSRAAAWDEALAPVVWRAGLHILVEDA